MDSSSAINQDDEDYISVDMREVLRRYAISMIKEEKHVACSANRLDYNHPARRFPLPRVLMDMIMDFVRDDVKLIIFQNGSYDFLILRNETSWHSFISKPPEPRPIYVNRSDDHYDHYDDVEEYDIVLPKRHNHAAYNHDYFDYESDLYESYDYYSHNIEYNNAIVEDENSWDENIE